MLEAVTKVPKESLVYIVDDDDAVRRSLALVLRTASYAVNMCPSGEAFLEAINESGAEALPAADRRLMCAVVDVLMPGGMDGIEVSVELSRRPIVMPVIIVTGHADVPLAVRAMRAGAIDFVEKPYTSTRLISAVAGALRVAADQSQKGLSAAAAGARVALLTPRERQVLRALIAGRSNKAIAYEMDISQRTVEAHRAAMMQRLGARSLPEAVTIGLAANLAEEPFPVG